MVNEIRDTLNTDDRQLWLLIGLCVALLLTVEAVEEAVEGAWPHERRTRRMQIGQQRGQPFWALVALLVLPGAVLGILNVGMVVWKDVPRTDAMLTGGLLLGIGWVLFVLGSVDRLRLRGFLTQGGPALPLVLTTVLLIACALLLSSFWDIHPSLDTIRDALPGA